MHQSVAVFDGHVDEAHDDRMTAEKIHVADSKGVGPILNADRAIVCLSEEDAVDSVRPLRRNVGVAGEHEAGGDLSGLLNDLVFEHVFRGAELHESRFHRFVYDETWLVDEREVTAESFQKVPFNTLDDDRARSLRLEKEFDCGYHVRVQLEKNRVNFEVSGLVSEGVLCFLVSIDIGTDKSHTVKFDRDAQRVA